PSSLPRSLHLLDLHSFPTRRSSDLLCHEFVERSRGVPLHYARALSHGRMLPFHAIVELARGLFGVDQAASDVRRRSGLVDAEERSEEHTSELQSRFDLVCRLLLEKK